MIYLDNASTTHHKPQCVVHSAKLGLTKYSVNAGRGGYALSVKGGEIVLDARMHLAEFFGLDKAENVIFTCSCTQAINVALRGTVKPNGHIIASGLEHNSVLRTLDDLKQKYGITYTLIFPNSNNVINITDFEKAIKPNTYLIMCIHVSNVTGLTQNISALGKVCKNRNITFFVDAAQSTGHIKIDMLKSNINLLAFAGHKGFYGPQGIGGLLINNTKVLPLITGGTGTFSESTSQPTDYPEGMESGTMSISNIMALNSGAKWVTKHFDKITKKVDKLTHLLIDSLAKINKVKLYSSFNHSGVVAFNIDNFTSSEVANYLSSKYNICVRSGVQCAPLVHTYYHTLLQGMVRVSIGYFNTKKEIITLVKTITSFIQNKTIR